MLPTRGNLILIICLCLLVLYVAASVRLYNSAKEGRPQLLGIDIPYAPYKIPGGPEASFYDPKTPEEFPKNVKTSVISSQTSSKKPGNSIPVSARAYLVGDIETGKIYYSRNSKEVLPVASMSKLITAFAAMDTITEDTLVEITEVEASLPADTSNLRAGEKIPMKTILYPLLLSSSNVAAEAIAARSGSRTNFLELMSSYAWEIGMPSTIFADASGLSFQNAASAEDLLALARYLYSSRAELLAITRIPYMMISTTSDHGSHQVVSTHPFVNDPDFIGGKTGRTTEAGETMMTLIRVKGRPIAIIVLGSQFGGREADTRLLLQKIRQTL